MRYWVRLDGQTFEVLVDDLYKNLEMWCRVGTSGCLERIDRDWGQGNIIELQIYIYVPEQNSCKNIPIPLYFKDILIYSLSGWEIWNHDNKSVAQLCYQSFEEESVPCSANLWQQLASLDFLHLWTFDSVGSCDSNGILCVFTRPSPSMSPSS